MNRGKMILIPGVFLIVVWGAGAAAAQDADDAHKHHHEHGAAGQDDHDHPLPEKSSSYEISKARYATPKLTLIDQYGEEKNAPSAGFFGTPDDENFDFIFPGHHVTRRCNAHTDKGLAEDRPTLVQFIFTSCTTICPVMGAVFGGAQEDIAAIAPNFRMVSISIDPEYDTPEKLREFAAKQNARPDWVFLTGAADDITAVTKSFDALNQGDNKMYHQPFTFIRWRKDDAWVRIRGLLSVADLVNEFSTARKVEAP